MSERVVVENNYLSSTEKSRQTYLNNKQNLTPEEQKDKEALNRKDLESDLAAYAACSGKGGDCQVERAKAKAAQDTYFNQTYQNPKEAQAGYQQIQSLLNSTDPNAKEVFNVLEGYTKAFMTFGYTEEEARARAGAYVGSMYIAGGVSAVVASGALTKQFGKDVALGVKPSAPSEKPGAGSTQTEGKPSSGAENVATYPKLKEDLVQQNLDNIAKQDPRLAAVVQGDNGKLNYGVGSGTKEEAERLGQIWVGDGAKLVTNQKDCPGCLISADGLRIYRPPSEKPNAPAHLNPTGIQANFVQQKDGKITGNAHMSIEK